MRGLWIENGSLRYREDLPLPVAGEGEARIRVLLAGICGTDLQLANGLYPFTGIPGHEFVGIVESGPAALRGKRVVSEININCGQCPSCLSGLHNHCPHRQAVGIRGRAGAFAEYVCLPYEKLHPVPTSISNEAAIFAEPLAAALEILEQVEVRPHHRVLVVGTGRLGQLVCRVLRPPLCSELVAVSRSPGSLQRLQGIASHLIGRAEIPARQFDVAVECTGNAAGFAIALDALRARGTLVLKSTHESPVALSATRIVVDELRVVGSRCGPFPKSLDMLEREGREISSLVTARYALSDGIRAFDASRRPGALKVALKCARA